MLAETLCQVLGMGSVDGKNQSRSAGGALVPFVHHISDQRRAVHDLGKIPFVVIASDGAHAFEVGMGRGENFKGAEIALSDQCLRRATAS